MYVCVCDHETFEGPLHHRKVRNPIGYDGKRVHRDVEASEQNADDYLRAVTCAHTYIQYLLLCMHVFFKAYTGCMYVCMYVCMYEEWTAWSLLIVKRVG